MREGGETPRPGCPAELPAGTEVNSGQVAFPELLFGTLSLTIPFQSAGVNASRKTGEFSL